jgi:hypothetical protein
VHMTHWSESRRTRNYILLSHLRFTRPGRPGPRIHIPRNRAAQLNPRTPCSLFVASYDSQGYGGGILAHLHKGRSMFPPFRFLHSNRPPWGACLWPTQKVAHPTSLVTIKHLTTYIMHPGHQHCVLPGISFQVIISLSILISKTFRDSCLLPCLVLLPHCHSYFICILINKECSV